MFDDELTQAEIDDLLDNEEVIAEERRQVADYTGPHTPGCPDTQGMPVLQRSCTGSCMRAWSGMCLALPPF